LLQRNAASKSIHQRQSIVPVNIGKKDQPSSQSCVTMYTMTPGGSYGSKGCLQRPGQSAGPANVPLGFVGTARVLHASTELFFGRCSIKR
jgi:hypothetical protein